MSDDPILARYRALCLSLPEAVETITWGEPHYRVAKRIFGGYGEEDGRTVIGFKLTPEHAAAIVADPRFRPAKYGGRHGWVSMDAAAIDDWEQLRELVLESYLLIAPKRVAARLGEAGTIAREAPRKSTARTTRTQAKGKRTANARRTAR
ncbi:MAG: MmcQ/YjbR family DNA-binding protein [Planctomycetes bacterium]|nr:MmcQ/YjbR family DNA-binding protein [Planctomycetota bacterium]